MTITIVILAYVANGFFNRWINKVLYKKDILEIAPFIVWFIPFFTTIVFLSIWLKECKLKDNWFTGKYW
jgi:hypothetical protein